MWEHVEALFGNGLSTSGANSVGAGFQTFERGVDSLHLGVTRMSQFVKHLVHF
jgi:hypothetical protein